MQHLTSQRQHHEIEFRRSKVWELSSQGNSEREIGGILQVHHTTVHRDLVHLRKQAQDNLQKHIHEVVPEEYAKCMLGIKRNLKQTLEIADTVSDPRTKLQARAIANDCYKYIMDLVTNGVVITDAMKYVIQKTEQVNSLQSQYSKSSENSLLPKQDLEGEREETTTNGVF